MRWLEICMVILMFVIFPGWIYFSWLSKYNQLISLNPHLPPPTFRDVLLDRY